MPSPFLPPSGRRRLRRRWPLFLVLGLLIVAGAAVGAYFAFVKKPGNTYNAKAPFEAQGPPAKPRPKPETFVWPIYGYDDQRTRYLDANLRPPYKQLWQFGRGALIEFQPVLANGWLYLVDNTGGAYAINAKTGRVKWHRKVGSLNASSPAWNNDRLYIATLSQSITCLNARNGKVIWKKQLPSRSESSPIVINGVVYFGSEDGTVYAYRASDGRKIWTYHASGAVKGGLAYYKGMLIFGDYSGAMTAIRAKDGSKVWDTATNGRVFNQSGQFYATPAVAFGRVYAGNTDGFVYSFVAKNGQLAWSHSTGNYVYSASAVANVPGLGPTAFVGSYDGHFYALDAKTGNVRWVHDDGGKISGAPTLVGDIVYFTNLGNKWTTGLDARTGKPVWNQKNGAFNPVISDGKRIYLTGYSSEFALVPKGNAKPKPKPKAHAKKKSKGT
jgi:outer membrane protein assembly factor BamB